MFNNLIKKINSNLKTYKIIRSILVFLLFWYSNLFRLIPIKLLHLTAKDLSSDKVKVLLVTFSSIVLLFIFLIIYREELKKEFKTFKSNFLECMDIGVRWWLIGLFLMVTSNLIITHILNGGVAGNEQQVQTLVKAVPWIMLFDAGFLAPFNEEIAFRKTIKDVVTNKWLFALISFLLFGGAHIMGNINTFTDVLYIFPYGFLGAVFALAYYDTDTVFTTISMHMIHNAILVLLSILVL